MASQWKNTLGMFLEINAAEEAWANFLIQSSGWDLQEAPMKVAELGRLWKEEHGVGYESLSITRTQSSLSV